MSCKLISQCETRENTWIRFICCCEADAGGATAASTALSCESFSFASVRQYCSIVRTELSGRSATDAAVVFCGRLRFSLPRLECGGMGICSGRISCIKVCPTPAPFSRPCSAAQTRKGVAPPPKIWTTRHFSSAFAGGCMSIRSAALPGGAHTRSCAEFQSLLTCSMQTGGKCNCIVDLLGCIVL